MGGIGFGVLAVAAAVCATVLPSPTTSNAAKPEPSVTSVTSTSAWSLINSIGVDIHASYNNTSYGDSARLERLVEDLGVRHIRDGISPNDPREVAVVQSLGRAGVDSDLIVGSPARSGQQSIAPDDLSELDTLSPDLDGIEAPNEWDCSGDSAWTQHLRDYDDALHSAVSADDDLQAVPILGPSYCDNADAVAYGALGPSASVVNLHDYASGAAPELSLESRVPTLRAREGAALPVEISEAGYTNAAHESTGQPAVTQANAADYDVRLLLDANRIGVKRTYLYELLDEASDPGMTNTEQHFGLVRSDGTPKAAYTSVQNLIEDLSDGASLPLSAPTSAPKRLPIDLQGGGSLLRSEVIADPSGPGHTVALWLAQPLENQANESPLPNRSETVQLTLGGNYQASTREPSRNNAAVSLGTGSTFTVPVDGAVTLVHLAPSSSLSASGRACANNASYASVEAADGAVLTNGLSPATASWSGSPVAASSTPMGVPPGVAITAAGQIAHLAVAAAPKTWTLTLWERSAPSSGNFAGFAHVSGAQGAQLRTYDVADDVPTHQQLSGFGLPIGDATYGAEAFGQAEPGTWHFVSLSNNGSTATLSIDGTQSSSVPSSSVTLGGIDVGSLSNHYRGSLAGLAVYPSVLDGAQLERLATTDATSCGPAASSVAPPLVRARALHTTAANVVVRIKSTHRLRASVLRRELKNALVRPLGCGVAPIRLAIRRHSARGVVRTSCATTDHPLRRSVRRAAHRHRNWRLHVRAAAVSAVIMWTDLSSKPAKISARRLAGKYAPAHVTRLAVDAASGHWSVSESIVRSYMSQSVVDGLVHRFERLMRTTPTNTFADRLALR